MAAANPAGCCTTEACRAGDSRAYLLRDGVLTRLTSDHSVVQELVDEGRITLAEAETHPSANMITRAVGSGGDLLLDKSVGDVRPNDCFLLCSDGLYKAVSETRIAAILGEEGDIAQALVAAALENRARDNVTAVVAKVEVD
jgi:serine/threonine protein phosphatase PrpC